MTETEKMRAILHERGIEYRDVNSMVTDVEHDGITTRVYDYDDGPDYQLCVEQKWLTAEEAVRVALGIKPQEVLERRIDELCAENAMLRERLKASDDGRMRQADNLIDKCHKIARLQTENAKLRELAARMARALGVGRWCSADCGREFGCDWTPDGCPIANAMRELEVDE